MGRNMKVLTDAISRLRPGEATVAELRAMEEILGQAGQAIQKMHQHLTAEERTYDAIQARYAQMISAAEHLDRQIGGNPTNRADLEASLTSMTDQLDRIDRELREDRVDVEGTRSLLTELEAAFRWKMQELIQARSRLRTWAGRS
jgi:chromosome segregation ATPase